MVRPVHTLGDARDVGLELTAVCRNMLCRRRVKLDIDKLIYQLGEGRALLPDPGKVHFTDKLRCQKCNHVGAFLWPGERNGMEPVFDAQGHQVNVWYEGTNLNTIAKVGHIVVAHATFEATMSAYPNRRVTLQQGGFVIRDSRMKVIRGGKA
jgi:hypothetical protein